MNQTNQIIDRPTGQPKYGTLTTSQIRRRQGTAACLVCEAPVSGSRMLCGSCREKLLSVGKRTIALKTHAVDVEANCATLVDVLTRYDRAIGGGSAA